MPGAAGARGGRRVQEMGVQTRVQEPAEVAPRGQDWLWLWQTPLPAGAAVAQASRDSALG